MKMCTCAFQRMIEDSQGASVHLNFTFYCIEDEGKDKDTEPTKVLILRVQTLTIFNDI